MTGLSVPDSGLSIPDSASPKIDVIRTNGPDQRAVVAAQVGAGEAVDPAFNRIAAENTAAAIAQLNAGTVLGDKRIIARALGSLVDGPAKSRLSTRQGNVNASVRNKGEWTPALRKQNERINHLSRALDARAASTDVEIVRLIGPENTSPEQQMLGYDLQRHMYVRQIKELQTQIKSAEDEGIKTELKAKQEAIEKKHEVAEAAKQTLIKGGIDAKGTKVEPHPQLKGVDMVVGCATDLAKKLNERVNLSLEDTQKITGDPIGHMEQVLSQAVEKPEEMQKLIDTKILTTKQAKELSDLVQLTAEEQKLIGKERADQLKTAGCGGIAFLLVMMYAASQREKAAKHAQMQ